MVTVPGWARLPKGFQVALVCAGLPRFSSTHSHVTKTSGCCWPSILLKLWAGGTRPTCLNTAHCWNLELTFGTPVSICGEGTQPSPPFHPPPNTPIPIHTQTALPKRMQSQHTNTHHGGTSTTATTPHNHTTATIGPALQTTVIEPTITITTTTI